MAAPVSTTTRPRAAALCQNSLRLPRIVQSGSEKKPIVWARPAYGMIHRMLNNPAYAGAFVYGRVHQDVIAGDPPTTTERRLPPEEWAIVVQDVYPAFISYGTFLANRTRPGGRRDFRPWTPDAL